MRERLRKAGERLDAIDTAIANKIRDLVVGPNYEKVLDETDRSRFERVSQSRSRG